LELELDRERGNTEHARERGEIRPERKVQMSDLRRTAGREERREGGREGEREGGREGGREKERGRRSLTGYRRRERWRQ
jgi:hypothetical protein